jgi:hypothetical protein
MKHKHYEFIVAWAGGAKIQWKNDLHDWRDIGDPAWINSYEYRIKPEPKPDYKKYFIYHSDRSCIYPYISNISNETANIVLTFDGETGELKSAEVIK